MENTEKSQFSIRVRISHERPGMCHIKIKILGKQDVKRQREALVEACTECKRKNGLR